MSRRILIIGPSWVGDTIMAQSLMKLIKLQDATTTIDVLAPAWTFSLLNCMEEVTLAHPLPITHGELKLYRRYAIGKALRAKQYDQAIVLPNSFKSALIPWFARIPLRTGWLGESRYGLLNDARRLERERYPLMVQQYLALGLQRAAPLPHPFPKPAFKLIASQLQTILTTYSVTITDRPILALAPGAAFGPAKCWPASYFAEVIKQKVAEGWQCWLFGSEADRAICEQIITLANIAPADYQNFSGRTTLAETIYLLSAVRAVLTNDSGLMHVAAALNKPLIALFGPTSPHFTPPLSDDAQIMQIHLECQPCFKRTCPLGHHRCMQDLVPQKVLQAMARWER
jgi:heptosyltransferase II